MKRSHGSSASALRRLCLLGGVPQANWLPVPEGKFNIMLRVYGVVPDSNVADNTYVPPAVQGRP